MVRVSHDRFRSRQDEAVVVSVLVTPADPCPVFWPPGEQREGFTQPVATYGVWTVSGDSVYTMSGHMRCFDSEWQQIVFGQ